MPKKKASNKASANRKSTKMAKRNVLFNEVPQERSLVIIFFALVVILLIALFVKGF